MPENASTQPKPKVSRLANASFICFLVASAIIILAIALSDRGLGHLVAFVGGVARTTTMAAVTAAPVLGIAALIAIARSNGALCGRNRAMAAVLIPSAMIVASGMGMLSDLHTRPRLSYEMLCGTNMKGLAKAFLVYAADNDDRLPDPAHWCDLLVMKADISPASFRCKASDEVKGESSYAMNIAATGMKLSEIPKDMVLLFEVAPEYNDPQRTFPITSRAYASDSVALAAVGNERLVCESRWNQICGPERIAVSNHKSGCNILFGDMHVEFVKTEDLPSLRWSIEGKVDFEVGPPVKPQVTPDRRPVYAILAASAACIILLVILCIFKTARPLAFFLTVAILAGLVGAGFGALSQQAHEFNRDGSHAGSLIGFVAGLVAGPCYVMFIKMRMKRISRASDAQLYAIATGMVTGIICAIIVHLTLMTIYHGGRIEGLMHGPYFGIIAGGFVGLIAAFFVGPALTTDESLNKTESTNA